MLPLKLSKEVYMSYNIEDYYNNRKKLDTLIVETYEKISKYYYDFLKKSNVKLPKLKDNNGNYIKDALVLVMLSQNYPNTEIISKEKLTAFVKLFYPEVNDVQQARHLGLQNGWWIISGTRGDMTQEKIPAGTYKLVSLEKPHPDYVPKRRTGIATSDFEELKKKYGYRCATCGSEEGKTHLFRKNIVVKLQEGHMNPKKDLLPGNIIPQCQVCNRPDRNRWIYDITGRVNEVADTPDGVRVVIKFIKNTSNDIRKKLLEIIKKYL